jgi:hypothetical protein
MEFEALFLGLEPLAALAVGIGAFALAPVVTTIGKAMGHDKLGEPLAESAKRLRRRITIANLAKSKSFLSSHFELNLVTRIAQL